MNGVTPAALLAIAAAIALPAGLLVLVLMARSASRTGQEQAEGPREHDDGDGGSADMP